MKSFFLFLAVLVVQTVHAKEMVLTDDSLGVEVKLQDSRVSAPLVSIVDKDGTDYSEIIQGINGVIAFHTIHCFEGGITGAINKAVGCDWIGFQPTDAKIVSYKSFLDGYPHPDLALVVRGSVQPQGGRATKTFFIPLEYLVTAKKKGETVRWWLTDGGVRSDEDYRFNRVDVNQIFGQ